MSKVCFIAFSFLFWLGTSPTALLNLTLTAIIFTAKNDGGIIQEFNPKFIIKNAYPTDRHFAFNQP